MPLPADSHASYASSHVIYKSSDEVDIVCIKLATASVDQDNRAMDNIVPETNVPVIDSALTTRRKIIPSMDLLHDCYSSDSSNNDPLSLSSTVTTSTDNASATASLKTPDSLVTLDFFDDSVFDGELDWIDSRSSSACGVLTASDRRRKPLADDDDQGNAGQWSTVIISDKEYRLDLKVIEPYKRVVSHGGYYGDGYNAIIVITACFLPDRGRRDYHYVMRNLFLYVISTLELLVMDDYMIIYFHGAAPRQRLPSFRWLRQCYEMTDRRYKKKLKKLLIVHPTFFLRTVMLMGKPFISSKFYCKLQYVRSLQELRYLVPMDHVFVCDEIREYDALRPTENANL